MKNLAIGVMMMCSVFGASSQSKFNNPILPGFYPDPSICRVNNDYYLVNSSFEYFPGVPIFHSKDLVNWEQIGHCLTTDEQLPLQKARFSGGIYAPTIRYNKGTYYMVTTNVSSLGNFYVTAKNPAGPWSEPIKVKQGGIDPTIFWDEDGKTYFMSTMDNKIFMSEINIENGELLNKPVAVWGGTGGRYPEAPHVYKKDGYYYLLIAEGGTEYAHMITIARSKNIYGPYESCPRNPILTHCRVEAQSNPIQGTGHGDLVQAQDGSWWIVFLAFRPNVDTNHLLGRETYLAPVEWDKDGWPIVNGGKPVTLDMNCKLPVQAVQSQNFDNKEEFDGKEVAMIWNYLRNPNRSNYSLSERKGFMRLKGDTIYIDQNDSPTFIGRRQQHMNFEATAKIEIKQICEKDRSGLSVYMNSNNHYSVFITEENNQRYVCLEYKLGKIKHIEKKIPVGISPILLKAEGKAEFYSFYYSEDEGKTFKFLGEADTRYLSKETNNVFTGVYIGLFAESAQKPGSIIADVDWFDYREKK